jgi:tetraacyldisaccharide 4'-kinase
MIWPGLWQCCFWLLYPLSCLFAAIVRLRRYAYQQGCFASYKAPVPVVVVGNLSVGGNGKTPMVIALVEYLRTQGWHPGVVSRAYKSSLAANAILVLDAHTPVVLAGDEPSLIYQRCRCPLAVGRQRGKALQALLQQHPAVDVIVSDDGLQHYALQRDLEILLIDSQTQLGNGCCLPAGPLREPMDRLNSVDLIWYTADFLVNTTIAYQLQAPEIQRPLQDFAALPDCHVLLGIARPQRVLTLLDQYAILYKAHLFADHHAYTAKDIAAIKDQTILMTEKDAIKCQHLPLTNAWVLPLQAVLSPVQQQQLRQCILDILPTP